MNRRNFITKGAAGIAALGAISLPGTLLGAGTAKEKLRIRIVYSLHAEQQARPDWPNQGFDFRPVMDRVNGELSRRFKDMEFLPTMATGEEQAKKILEQDGIGGGVDGYVVYQMNCWNRVIQTIATSGKPVIYADFQYGGSGGFLVYNAAILRANTQNVGFVASSDIKHLVEAVRCFRLVGQGASTSDFVAATSRVRAKYTPSQGRLVGKRDDVACISTKDCLTQLKETKLLAFRDQTSGSEGEVMGIKVERLPFSELNEAWKNADKDEARAIADSWTRSARKIEEVSRETMETSAAMYLAQKAMLKKHGAKGITINCLGGFYGGHIHAYPCLGFYQLLNDGLIGACECDVRSATTMLIGTTLTQGRPGYISDPVIDTSKRQIIYAHCVASNKAYGPQGETNPFDIMTHSEDRQGASVRSLLPTRRMVTSLEFDQAKKEVLFHRALAVANDPDDRACRTKLCAEPVGDIEKLFTMWDQWSWHRVTFYGDLKEPIFALADAAGWKVVEEA
jgi:hypothetical protein